MTDKGFLFSDYNSSEVKTNDRGEREGENKKKKGQNPHL
jgi:hypothetical protein